MVDWCDTSGERWNNEQPATASVNQTLGPGPEFDRIRAILHRLGSTAHGIGDDCAIVQVGTECLALSSDLSLEGVHFRRGWLSLEEIGWRAATAALSDLAAVAATPAGILVSVGLSPELPEDAAAELMAGAGAAADAAGATVWGGDLTRSEKIVVDVAVVGRMEGEPVLRKGAVAGDGLWVTGVLGGPAAALAAWVRNEEPEASARERFAHPVARVAEAKWLRDRGATAMIDLSDGLSGDVSHLAAASGVRCEIEVEKVPTGGRADGQTGALTSGEEYELLVALPSTLRQDMATEFESKFGIPLTRIGAASAGAGVRIIRNGQTIQVPGAFSHF